MSFPSLYESAGPVTVGNYVGGDYVYDFSIEINRVAVTVEAAPSVATVLDLVIGGQLTGTQVVLPSGLPGSMLDFTQWINPPVTLTTSLANGLTPSMRWQCISGTSNPALAASGLDLLAWAERLVAFPPGEIPFSGGSLVSPALSEGNVEAGAQTLLAEWLGDYFDGNPHMIGVNASGVFPLANIRFEQGEIQQPLNPPSPAGSGAASQGLEIRLTTGRRAERRDIMQQGWLMTAPVVLDFWVRAKKQGRGQGSYLARTASELLYSILNNPENTLALAEKGIKHLFPKGGVTIPSKDWSEQLVTVAGEFSWWVYFDYGGS